MNKALYFAGFLCLCLFFNALGNVFSIREGKISSGDTQAISNDAYSLPLQSDNNEVIFHTVAKYKQVKADQVHNQIELRQFSTIILKFVKQQILSAPNYIIPVKTRAP
jgi:hypothetical protein